MGLRIVGAGLPRTGTTSLKGALERLLGAPCYHMRELFGRPDDAAVWRDA
ncbi:sulfotransferase, partial [Nonomuraea sp. NPDC049784]